MEMIQGEKTAIQSDGVTLVAKWGKERITLDQLDKETTIGAVKDLLSERTGVLPKRQKLIGLKASSKINDSVLLRDLKVKNSKKTDADGGIVHEFLMMGTREENIFVDPNEKADLPDVVDDFDLDFNAGSTEWLRHVANGQNLKKFTESTQLHIMNEPRPGKPLLVLDLDHTLLDFSSKTLQRDSTTHQVGAGMAAVMKRPFMDEFLVSAYKNYDLVVWSQTSWRVSKVSTINFVQKYFCKTNQQLGSLNKFLQWLEIKLIELGMLTNPGYKFCFVLDKTSMFKISSTKRNGSSVVHHVKPLQIIWSKFDN